MTAQYLWLVVFSFALYFIITDESIAAAFYYITRLAKSYIQRQWWWLLHNPKNPVVKYLIYRRSLKMAEQLMYKINTDKEKE
jgi:hypothetical protein